jgi:hypothetical protein
MRVGRLIEHACSHPTAAVSLLRYAASILPAGPPLPGQTLFNRRKPSGRVPAAAPPQQIPSQTTNTTANMLTVGGAPASSTCTHALLAGNNLPTLPKLCANQFKVSILTCRPATSRPNSPRQAPAQWLAASSSTSTTDPKSKTANTTAKRVGYWLMCKQHLHTCIAGRSQSSKVPRRCPNSASANSNVSILTCRPATSRPNSPRQAPTQWPGASSSTSASNSDNSSGASRLEARSWKQLPLSRQPRRTRPVCAA